MDGETAPETRGQGCDDFGIVPLPDVVSELTAMRLGFIVGPDGLWAPTMTHDEHQYEFNCAICRAGDRPDALAALVATVSNIAAPRRLRVNGDQP